jgi:hypothetical protein
MAMDRKDPNSERGGMDIKYHRLVDRLLQDAGELKSLVILVGYIGPSKKEAHVRLYTGLDFQTYCEIPRGAVVAADAVDPEDENCPTQLAVTAETTIHLVQTSEQTGPASYLAGSIAAAYLAGPGPAGGEVAAVGPAPRTLLHGCRRGPSKDVESALGHEAPAIAASVLCGSAYLCPSQFGWHCHTRFCAAEAAEQPAAYMVRSRIACTALPGCGGTNFHYHC